MIEITLPYISDRPLINPDEKPRQPLTHTCPACHCMIVDAFGDFCPACEIRETIMGRSQAPVNQGTLGAWL